MRPVSPVPGGPNCRAASVAWAIALRRRGMGRHHVGAIGGASARDRSAKRAPLAERGEKSSRAIGVISGVGDGLDADLVGGEFLFARETGDRELRARLDFVLSFALGEQLRIDAREQRRRLFELGPLGGVARGDMADFMRHDRGDFRCVLGEGQKAAGDEDIARGQGEGVDDRRIQHGDAVGRSRGAGGRRDLRENAVEIGLGRRRRVDAAERLDQPLSFRIGLFGRNRARRGRRGDVGGRGRRIDRGASR